MKIREPDGRSTPARDSVASDLGAFNRFFEEYFERVAACLVSEEGKVDEDAIEEVMIRLTRAWARGADPGTLQSLARRQLLGVRPGRVLSDVGPARFRARRD